MVIMLANYDQVKIIHKNQVLHNTAQKIKFSSVNVTKSTDLMTRNP